MENSRETKSSRLLRVLLSFALFIMIVLVSLSSCSKSVFLNKSLIEDLFTDYDYVSCVKADILEYANDIYLKNGLDGSSLDSVFDDRLVEETIKAYVAGTIGSSIGYSETTYLESVENMCVSFEADLKNQLDKKGLAQDSECIYTSVELMNSCIISAVDISIPNLKNIMNIGSIASVAVIGVSLFFAVSLGLILFFIGDIRYRSLRAVSISFFTAGLFDIFLSFMAYIIFKMRHIDIFPIYLRELVMRYIGDCMNSVAVAGCLLLFVGLIASVATWKIRKERVNRG